MIFIFIYIFVFIYKNDLVLFEHIQKIWEMFLLWGDRREAFTYKNRPKCQPIPNKTTFEQNFSQ